MEEPDQVPANLRGSSSEEPLSVRSKGGEAERVNTGCGWGRFRPAILSPFAHVWTFIVLYVVFSFTHAVQGSYPTSVLTTLERRFNLSSSLVGFVVNTSLFGYVIGIVIVSLFFTKSNKPRIFAFCMLLTSIGAFLYYLPHLVCGTGNNAINEGQSPLNATALPDRATGVVQLCVDDSGVGGPLGAERNCSVEQRQKADEGVSYVLSAVVILSIADFVHGIAGAASWTVGLAFIDDNTHPELSAKLVGLMFTVRLLSPIASFSMGSYLLSIHTTLRETDLTQKHPQWIGAWWMGFLINSIANFVIFIPMSMLPKNLKPIRRSSSVAASPKKGKKIAADEKLKEDGTEKKHEKEKRKEDNDEVHEKQQEEEQNKNKVEQQEEEGKNTKHKNEDDEQKEKDEKRENLEEGEHKKKEGLKEEKMVDLTTSDVHSTTEEEISNGPMESIGAPSIDCKELPKAMTRLITNPIYVVIVISICCDWASSSFSSFMPKYFEVHFQQTASVASLLGGMIPAICGACAAFVGGILAGKIKGIDGGVAGLSRMNFLISLGSLLLIVPSLFLSCPNIPYAGNLVNGRLNLTTDCNVNCGCTSDVFDPVCGSDGLLYFSPCHAGCTQLVNSTGHPNAIPGRLVRSGECRCIAETERIDEDERGSVVFAGFCEAECASLIPYVLTLIALAIVRSLDSASSTTVIFRCVRKEDKSYALGLQALCLVLAILPVPLLYGKVFDSSCILKRTASCTDSKGSCLLYDRRSLRLNFHGLSMGLKSISTILYFITYFIARRKLSLLKAQQKMRQTELETNGEKPKETETSML